MSLWFMRQTSKIARSVARRGVQTSCAPAAAGEFLANAAFKPTKAGDVWRKASVSPKNVARLMKEQGISKSAEKAAARAEAPPSRPPKPPKGHKVDRLKVALVAEREAKLAGMDVRVAEYRKKKREAVMVQTSAMDRLTMTKLQLRLKARNTQ